MSIARFTLVQLAAADGGHPAVTPWDPAAYEQPGLSTAHKLLGVTMTTSEFEEPVAVMRRGILRDVARQNSETWAVGDVLWAKSDGTITKTRPAAPLPLVVVGTVFETVGVAHTVDVDVRVLPSLGELSGVAVETPGNLDVLIYNSTSHCWEPRPLAAADVANTPYGDIAATTVQAALNELDDEKVKVAGQIGGTADSPAIIGITTTTGPTALTLGAIADGEFLKRVGATVVSAAAGTPAALDDVGDVVITTVADEDVLTWDAGTSKWVNAPPAAGASALDDLTDVVAPTPSDNDVLSWDAGTSKWINVVPAAGAAALNDLTDVNTAGAVSTNVLAFDGAGWVPAAAAAPGAHASAHENGGADEIAIENLGTAETVTTKVLKPNGTGGVAWGTGGAGGGTVHHQARFALFSPPAGGSFYPLLEACATFSVVKVRAIHTGSGAVSVNVKKNHRAADTDVLSSDLASASTWQNSAAAGGSASLAAGDELDVELAGVTGYVEQVVVQVDYEETLA